MTPSKICRFITLTVTSTLLLAALLTPASAATRFSDVPATGWKVEPIAWIDEVGVTEGCDVDRFCPDEPMTREQQITFLWRYENRPAADGDMPFTDVPADRFFTDAVAWAYIEGITEGIGNNKFGTGRDVTRAEAVTFLWRYAGEPAPEEPLRFDGDVAEGTFYTDAVAWATEAEVTFGCNQAERRFCPERPVTRAEFAAFLQRFDAIPDDAGTVTEFPDLDSDPDPEPEPEPEPVYYHEFVADYFLVTPPEGYRAWLQYEWFEGSLSMRNAHVEGCTGEITGHLTWVYVYKVDDGCTTSTGTVEFRFYKVENKYEDHIWLTVPLSDARDAWDR